MALNTTITGMTMGTTITPMTDAEWLYPLTAWLSPAYPVGAYSYSHGLEWLVETGAVTDAKTLADYVTAVLQRGGGWTDLVLFAAITEALATGDEAQVDEVVELAQALRGSAEMALETAQQGAAFVLATRAAWAGTPLDRLAERWAGGLPYPIAVAAACAGRAPLPAALALYAQALAANLVSAGVRLIPLGQTSGQQTLAALAPVVAAASARARVTPLDELGNAAPLIDIASMRHETQYTRLFRS